MGDFSVSGLLRLGADKLAPKLVDLGKDQVRKLLSGEQAQGVKARSNMVRLLQAELEGRAGQLADGSVELIARAVASLCDEPIYALLGATPGDELSDEQRGEVVGLVRDLLAGGSLGGDGAAIERAVAVLCPIFNTIEEMAGTIAELSGAVPREQVGPGAVAELRPPEGGAEQAKLLERVVELAFCEGRDVMFKIAAEGADFIAGLGKVAFAKGVKLKRDKPRVRIDQVVALDAEGRPIARRRMPMPLEGGGGRQALFPARSISFDL